MSHLSFPLFSFPSLHPNNNPTPTPIKINSKARHKQHTINIISSIQYNASGDRWSVNTRAGGRARAIPRSDPHHSMSDEESRESCKREISLPLPLFLLRSWRADRASHVLRYRLGPTSIRRYYLCNFGLLGLSKKSISEVLLLHNYRSHSSVLETVGESWSAASFTCLDPPSTTLITQDPHDHNGEGTSTIPLITASPPHSGTRQKFILKIRKFTPINAFSTEI